LYVPEHIEKFSDGTRTAVLKWRGPYHVCFYIEGEPVTLTRSEFDENWRAI
jgi:hypothetical protein